MVVMVVELPYTVEEFQAPAVQNSFKRGVALAARTRADKVTINLVTAVNSVHSHLLADAIDIDFSIAVETESAGQNLVIEDDLSLERLIAALAIEEVEPISAVKTAPTVVLSSAARSTAAGKFWGLVAAALLAARQLAHD
eukprot:1056948-Rhodomonas_salina.1